nr:glycosyl hydrolase [Bacteroidales bacterium]
MKNYLLFLLFGGIMACSGDHHPAAPANSDASPEAIRLLKFLYSIQGKYILSGQHNFLYEPVKYTNLVYQITGRYPVVWGCDFSFSVTGEDARKYQHCGPANLIDYADSFRLHGIHPDTLRGRMVQKAIELWKKGHIITLMWHHCFPPMGDSCSGSSVWAMENRPSPELWDSLVTEGTTLNNQWKKQADIVIPWLQKLRDA